MPNENIEANNGYLLASVRQIEARVDRLFEWQKEARIRGEQSHKELLDRINLQDKAFEEIRIGIKWVRWIGCGILWTTTIGIALVAAFKGDFTPLKSIFSVSHIW